MDNIQSIANLITDMTLNGATEDELRRAIRYSVIVMDVNKRIRYAEHETNINELKDKYGNKCVKCSYTYTDKFERGTNDG